KKGQPKVKTIEGVWTAISKETEGEIISMLPDPIPRLNAPITGYYLWKISKETIEMGPDFDEFPLQRYTYKLNPGGQADALDLIPSDKKEHKGMAIYSLKNDYMMICFGRNARPKWFSSSIENPTTIHILRRGKQRTTGQGSTNPKRKEP